MKGLGAMWRNFRKLARSSAMGMSLSLLAVAVALLPAQAEKRARLVLHKGLFLTAQGAAQPPMGFLEFCGRYPEECRPLGKPGNWTIRLTPTNWDLLRQVNSYINHRIRPVSDQVIYNRPEVWEYPEDNRGDCEDYVLLKKRYLEALGFPSEALLIAVVLDENGKGHAVLLARTGRGDLVLDNRRDDIRLWRRTGYQFLMRQSQRHPGRWVSLTAEPDQPPRIFGVNR